MIFEVYGFLLRFPAVRTCQMRRPAHAATRSAPEAIVDRPNAGEGPPAVDTRSSPVVMGATDTDRAPLAPASTGPGAGLGVPVDAASSPLAWAEVSAEHGMYVLGVPSLGGVILTRIESNIAAGDSAMQDDPIGGQPPDDTSSPGSLDPSSLKEPARDEGEVASTEYPLSSF